MKLPFLGQGTCSESPFLSCPKEKKTYYHLSDAPPSYQEVGIMDFRGNLFCTSSLVLPDGTEVDFGSGSGEVTIPSTAVGTASTDVRIKCAMYMLATRLNIGTFGLWADLTAEPIPNPYFGNTKILLPNKIGRKPFEITLKGTEFNVLPQDADECERRFI